MPKDLTISLNIEDTTAVDYVHVKKVSKNF